MLIARILFCLAPLLSLGFAPASFGDGPSPSRAPIAALLEQYCFDCHGPDLQEAGVDLTSVGGQAAFLEDRQLWQRVDEVLRAGQMPPEDAMQPTADERKQLVESLHAALSDVDWEEVKSPGQAPLARLTRAEYGYTVADLFGVEVDLSEILPADPEGLSGFANDRSSMMISGRQLDGYLTAAGLVADTVLDAPQPSAPLRYEVETGENANSKQQPAEAKDGTTGWTFSSALGRKYQSVRKAIDFPKTGFYRVRIRARSTGPGPMAGLWIAADNVRDASRQPGVLVQGKQWAEYETEMFLEQGRHDILLGYDFYRPLWLPDVPQRPQMKLGQSTFDPPPYDRQSLLPEGVSWDELVTQLQAPAPKSHERARELIETINENYYRTVLDRLMLNKFHYTKGYLPVFIGGLGYDYREKVVPAFEELAKLLGVERGELEKLWERHKTPVFDQLEEVAAKQREAWNRRNDSRKAAVGGLFVDWVEFEAVPAGDEVIEIPSGADGVDPFLSELLPKAFRRPVSPSTAQRYHALYTRERNAGANHRQALRRTLVAVLVSPDFLYRFEGPAPDGVEQLSGPALAARLSYWLWSSMPDAELADAARRDHLRSGDQIDRQVDRMLRDERSSRLARQFTQQWLNLSEIGRGKEPDKELFRYFSWHLAEDMRREVAMMFERILREDRSILELLDHDRAFLNERLARLYGIEGVEGADMRMVPLADRRRGGLLGAAAVLTSTSLATRTSPVRRGQFVVETLLGVDLPPPPPGVPELPEDAGQNEKVSLRETLALHRQDPHCASCHEKFDPLGLALENFDWIGRPRDRAPGGVVDTAVQLTDGTRLDGPAEVKAYLVKQRKDDFTRALTEGLLAYALGRELQYFDEHAIRSIVSAVKRNGYSGGTLVREIAKSYPMRYRTGAKGNKRHP